MVFSSVLFLFLFLPIALTLHLILPRAFRNLFLLASSVLFYMWGEMEFGFLICISVLLNYALGYGIHYASSPRDKKIILGVTMAANLAMLAVFKYANFVVENLNVILTATGVAPIDLEPVQLPIGISFFTFQAMTYVVDVYRKEVEVERNPLNVGLYIFLFPQLIAGPIVRFVDVAAQIHQRDVTVDQFALGVRRFTIGLAKKLLIANTVAVAADGIFDADAGGLTTASAWLAIVCYSLQIYYDFSGYSDMAIGMGHMLGFKFLENFNYPYIARSMTDFWRRWHISLSTWFRDYLYLPLGGNRRSPLRTYLNLMTVFFLCGLWHGASWNFVVWGMFHGMFLVIERLLGRNRIGQTANPLNHLYVLVVVIVAWVFFRATTMSHAYVFLVSMAGFAPAVASDLHGISAARYLNRELIVALIFGILFSTPLLPTLVSLRERVLKRWSGTATSARNIFLRLSATVEIVGLMLLWVGCAMQVAASTHNPFIYFRF